MGRLNIEGIGFHLFELVSCFSFCFPFLVCSEIDNDTYHCIGKLNIETFYVHSNFIVFADPQGDFPRHPPSEGSYYASRMAALHGTSDILRHDVTTLFLVDLIAI
mgnify:CR=1 FL=1|jgi:hypothetical protein